MYLQTSVPLAGMADAKLEERGDNEKRGQILEKRGRI